jgi:hypothetical protein
MNRILIAAATVMALTACTDAKMKQFTTIGSPGEIVCYSGTLEIYRGKSTGKIATEQGSDGWFFQEEGTGKLIRVSGACVIRN